MQVWIPIEKTDHTLNCSCNFSMGKMPEITQMRVHQATCQSGREADGSGFKTAAAKTYPPPMCRMISDTVTDSLVLREGIDFQHCPWQDVGDFVRCAHAPLDVSCELVWEHGYAPEFHRESLMS